MSAHNAYEYHLSHWSDIQDHLQRLFEAARGNVLEIGVRSGCSTSALLAGVEEHGGHLWSIDINNCPIFAGHPNWTSIQANSVTSAEELKAVLPESLDLLFVDGDHTYEGALSDLQNFGPQSLRILVHDTNAPDFPGVRKAVTDYCDANKRTVEWVAGSFGMADIR